MRKVDCKIQVAVPAIDRWKAFTDEFGKLNRVACTAARPYLKEG